jgi:polysaccharide export outer membrane protein
MAVRCALAMMAVSAAMAGCSFLPASGPSGVDIVSNENSGSTLSGYIVLDLDERIASIYNAQTRQTFARFFQDNRPAPDLRVGVGDSVSVTIWEAASNGLFSASSPTAAAAAGSRTATIPEQVVSRDGTIRVPYAGRVPVAGKTPEEVEQAIVAGLSGKAIEPQAVVTISKSTSNTATVTGEVTNGARVPLTLKGDRILDVIAAAGGIKSPAHESFIRLTRGRTTTSVAFNTILSDPPENIYVRPGDVLTVVRSPQTFTAFGGAGVANTGQNASIPFNADGISLEEAIAKAGGLLDFRADPGGVFLLRFEATGLVQLLAPGKPLPSNGNVVPVIYRLNLREANAFFLARAFRVKDKDMLYIANAASDPVQKFLGLVGSLTAPAISGASLYGGIRGPR